MLLQWLEQEQSEWNEHVITEEVEPLKVFERRMGVDVDSVPWSLGDSCDVSEVQSASTFDLEDEVNIVYSYIMQ